MAILASKSPSGNTSAPEVLYTAPTGRRATVNIMVANRGQTQSTIRLWMTKAANAAAVSDNELIEVDTPLTPRGTTGNAFERTAITLAAGESVYFGGSATTISFTAHGYEEIA